MQRANGRHGASLVLVLAEGNFVAANGLRFTARAYKDRGKILVSFRFDGPSRFCPNYFYETLAGTSGNYREPRPRGRALNLLGGKPAWTIDGETMDEVMDWLEAEVGPPPVTPFLDDPNVPF